MTRLVLAAVAAASLITAPAAAQPQQQPPTAQERALSARVMQEISASVQKDVAILQLQDQLDAAKKRIEELEKQQPKKGE